MFLIVTFKQGLKRSTMSKSGYVATEKRGCDVPYRCINDDYLVKLPRFLLEKYSIKFAKYPASIGLVQNILHIQNRRLLKI